MSFKLTVEVFDAKIGNPARKLVLLKLADQANDNGLCWPSYATVAKACEVDRRTVIRHIKKLEEDGFLTIEKTYDKEAGKNFNNRYHLTIANGVKKSLVSESHHPSDNLSPSLVSESLHPSDTVSPKPINEPINIDPINESNTNSVCESEKPVVVIDERKVLVNQLFDTWLELSDQRIKPLPKRLSHINARLDDGFTPEQIIAAMTYVATDSWHVDKGNNTIELAIRSVEQIEKKLIKATAATRSANKGINNDSLSHTPHQSPANSNMQQIRDKFAAEQSAKQSNHRHDHAIRTVHG
ncbi:helix-turn-helix domain-containing protein [Psychrobacter faecalis]|uniref:helix-turn-helix domain-containing protein n=1 Tax=Psychrobacter faecalis TaxID=180588 RepID=UPI003FCEF099